MWRSAPCPSSTPLCDDVLVSARTMLSSPELTRASIQPRAQNLAEPSVGRFSNFTTATGANCRGVAFSL